MDMFLSFQQSCQQLAFNSVRLCQGTCVSSLRELVLVKIWFVLVKIWIVLLAPWRLFASFQHFVSGQHFVSLRHSLAWSLDSALALATPQKSVLEQSMPQNIYTTHQLSNTIQQSNTNHHDNATHALGYTTHQQSNNSHQSNSIHHGYATLSLGYTTQPPYPILSPYSLAPNQDLQTSALYTRPRYQLTWAYHLITKRLARASPSSNQACQPLVTHTMQHGLSQLKFYTSCLMSHCCNFTLPCLA